MDYKDYYAVMGVKNDATQDEIKRAYRKLARKYHPDVSQEADSEEKFKELGEAYEVLKDPEKRSAYDQLGAQWKAGQEFHPPPGWDAGFEFSERSGASPDMGGFSDFFESLFGQARRQAGSAGRSSYGASSGADRGFQMRGEDHHAKIIVDLEDSYRGATRTITLQVPQLGEDGHVTTRARSLNVRIPKGIRQGQQIRLTGQGGAGYGGAASGDLYLEVEFNPGGKYRVEGADVYMDLPLAPWEAALGGKVKVPTPGGVVELAVPPNSQQGRKLRLKGRGLPAKKPGNLYVSLQVALPPADTDKAKELYQKMAEELDFDPRQNLMRAAQRMGQVRATS